MNDAEARQRISEVDLTQIRRRAMREAGWDEQRASEIEQQYRAFLYVIWKYGEGIPNVEIDDFWHAHILYTKQYTEDCMRIFGKYLHHNPEIEHLTDVKI